ncbi:ribosomal protein L29 [Salinibacter ruber DSM 13855]|uniref:Large ribosomal subunit protein uL29 n=3 Tax=Salinibacter ruber TaxID=146919 RepID=Q2S3Q6_SALRD|nr:ribosomal protein L29 [Salinibacter ruber DSM 13855]CBH24165.1 50S ribosomal protein L29 [Salinibacter ruber M8]
MRVRDRSPKPFRLMDADQIRDLSIAEIETRIDEEEEELEELQFQHAIRGRLENPMLLRTKRRLIARLKTIRNEKQAVEEEPA